LLRATPLHFAIIDAVVRAHGSGAARAPRPIETNCIIAATDVQLADHIGALKMGADPAISRIWSAVTARRPMPKKYSLHGELRVYPGWRNVNPVLVDSARKRNASTTAQRLTAPWLQTLDPTMFPLKSPVDAQVNASVAPLFANLDDDPGALSTLVLLNHLIAASARTLDMYRTIFDKDALQHIHVPLGLNLGEYPPAAYAAIYPELAALAPLLADLPEQAAGLKWRYIDEAVVFQYTRTIPVDFDTFVSKVDVARTIQYLNDYIGGVIVPVEHDRQGRVTRQAERNVYLPQPNYVVLADGKPIDVSKLETVYYADGLHRMCWKTVKSENESAKSDDGIVTFERDANAPAQTIVTILGKQLFVLPPFWQAMSLDLNPDLRAHLVTDAYRTFFDRSVANLEALLEDRDIRIGKAWHQPTTPDDHAPPPSQSVERIVSQTISRVKDWLPQTNLASPPAETGAADDNGFVHFSASTAQLSPALETQNSATAPTYSGLPTTMGSVTRFWTGLAESISRDLGNGTRK
jgi:hypothetical protein